MLLKIFTHSIIFVFIFFFKFFMKFDSHNRSGESCKRYYVFGYVRAIPGDFKSCNRLVLIPWVLLTTSMFSVIQLVRCTSTRVSTTIIFTVWTGIIIRVQCNTSSQWWPREYRMGLCILLRCVYNARYYAWPAAIIRSVRCVVDNHYCDELRTADYPCYPYCTDGTSCHSIARACSVIMKIFFSYLYFFFTFCQWNITRSVRIYQ